MKEWELLEQKRAKEARDSSFHKVKVLHDDMGCEQVSRTYHIANKLQDSKPEEAVEVPHLKSQEYTVAVPEFKF